MPAFLDADFWMPEESVLNCAPVDVRVRLPSCSSECSDTVGEGSDTEFAEIEDVDTVFSCNSSPVAVDASSACDPS